MFPLPMQRIDYSAKETLQSYEFYSGKENIKMKNDEKSVSPYKFSQTPYTPITKT